MRQVIIGIKKLHSMNIIHRDLKIGNLMIAYPEAEYVKLSKDPLDMRSLLESDFALVKIIDLGVSRKLNNNNDLA